MTQQLLERKNQSLTIYTRSGEEELERPYEKPVIVSAPDNKDPATHAWADARFATDIMAEHAFFFALLMPEELAKKEREEALRFSHVFASLHQQIDTAGPKSLTEQDRDAVQYYICIDSGFLCLMKEGWVRIEQNREKYYSHLASPS